MGKFKTFDSGKHNFEHACISELSCTCIALSMCNSKGLACLLPPAAESLSLLNYFTALVYAQDATDFLNTYPPGNNPSVLTASYLSLNCVQQMVLPPETNCISNFSSTAFFKSYEVKTSKCTSSQFTCQEITNGKERLLP